MKHSFRTFVTAFGCCAGALRFSVFVVASLALGIGATSAIFSLFDAIVLRELPVRQPDGLIRLAHGTPDHEPNSWMPYPHFERMHALNTTLEGLFALASLGRINIAFNGQPELASGAYATGEYHQVLGVQPALGRLLTKADDRPGNTVAVLSYAYWQRRFGRNPQILGASIFINQVPFTVVGVEPRGFFGVTVGASADVTVPMRTRDLLAVGQPLWNQPYTTSINVMGRLKSGVSREQAAQELNLIYRQVNADAVQSASAQFRSIGERIAREAKLTVESGATGQLSGLRRNYERWLRLILMLLGAVLLLASLNVATLLLSRAESRQREIAGRMALGAGRWRIVRQLLTESIVLASVGGMLGFALAWWGSGTLLRVATSSAQNLPIDLTPDFRALAFTIAVSGLTCLLFGLIPALRATSSRTIAASRQIGGGRRRRLLDRALVSSQVALSLVLLVCAGLFLRSLQNLWTQDPGYDRRNVLMFSVDAALAGKKGPEVPAAYKAMLNELRTVPGVQSASLSAVRPVDDNAYFVDRVTKIGNRALSEDQSIRVAQNYIGPGYFGTLAIPILAGRDFDERDNPEAPKVVIISETMARRRFAATNPVGQLITMHFEDTREIVGIAKDMRYGNVKDAPRDVIYCPIFQVGFGFSPTFEIRYAGRTAEVLRQATEVVSRSDRSLTLHRVKTLEVQTRESLSRERLLALLGGYFGAFALLLACVGLYGLLAYNVVQRTPELGLRMALGARPAGVRWMVLRESGATVLAGVAVGLLAARGAVRLVETQLYGVQPYDAATLIIMTALLLAMAFAASYIPAARASCIDPMHALRHD